MLRKTGRSKPASVLDSGPSWGVHDQQLVGTTRPSTDEPKSATLPRMGKKSRAPAIPPSSEPNSRLTKVGRSVITTDMATFHHPRRKFHIPCKGRPILPIDDDEVHHNERSSSRFLSDPQRKENTRKWITFPFKNLSSLGVFSYSSRPVLY